MIEWFPAVSGLVFMLLLLLVSVYNFYNSNSTVEYEKDTPVHPIKRLYDLIPEGIKVTRQ